MKNFLFFFTFLFFSFVDSVSSENEFKLEDSINNVNRNEKNIIRDKYRNL